MPPISFDMQHTQSQGQVTRFEFVPDGSDAPDPLNKLTDPPALRPKIELTTAQWVTMGRPDVIRVTVDAAP